MHGVIAEVAAEMPAGKPRYLMGVGTPEDIWQAIGAGIDMFDCVMPTRNARNGQLFTRAGRLNIGNARHRDEDAAGGRRGAPAPAAPATAAPTWPTSFTPRSCFIIAWRRSTTSSTT